MLKLLLTGAAIIAFGIGSASAQQLEAILQKVEVPGAAFDLMLAMPKTPTVIIDLSESPDALVIHLVGGKLALGFEKAEDMLKATEFLRSPVGAFHIRPDNGNARVSAAVYVVPKGHTLASAQR